MSSIIVGGMVGAWVAYWMLGHTRYALWYWRNRQQRDKAEARLREAFEIASNAIAFRVAGPGDAQLIAALDRAATDQAALETCGFSAIGEVIAEPAGKPVSWLIRAFVDAAGTTYAFIQVAPALGDRWQLGLRSFVGDEDFTTLRYQPKLASAPSQHFLMLAKHARVTELLARHRAFVPSDAALVRIADIDELLELLRTSQQRTLRWRHTQPPDALLDADLRGIFGAQYDRAGRYWARRLRAPVPTATVHRAPRN